MVRKKRRAKYQAEVDADQYNFDAWFDLINLAESEEADSVEADLSSSSPEERVRDCYERAIACVPPVEEKRYWRRYIYLWIKYALFEELDVQDVDRARLVYDACLSTIPHRKFTFAKIWLLAAQFEIRQRALGRARKILVRGFTQCHCRC